MSKSDLSISALDESFGPKTYQWLDVSGSTPQTYKTDTFEGKVLTLHRPTFDPSIEKSAFPYDWHFKGRRRLWELRIQGTFRKDPEATGADFRFGVELHRPTPANRMQRAFTEYTVSMMQALLGDLYHSFGDDESVPENERERGIGTLPVVGCDTVIMSRPGEEPPLDGPLWYIGDRCWHRTDGMRKMEKECGAHVFNTETVYTFCFWGVSQYSDLYHWRMVKLSPGGSSFDTFTGPQYVNLTLFILRKDESTKKVLQRNKTYMCDLLVATPPHSSMPDDLPEQDFSFVTPKKAIDPKTLIASLQQIPEVLESAHEGFWPTFLAAEIPCIDVFDLGGDVDVIEDVNAALDAIRASLDVRLGACAIASFLITDVTSMSKSEMRERVRSAQNLLATAGEMPKPLLFGSAGGASDDMDRAFMHGTLHRFVYTRDLMQRAWPTERSADAVTLKAELLRTAKRTIPVTLPATAQNGSVMPERREEVCCGVDGPTCSIS